MRTMAGVVLFWGLVGSVVFSTWAHIRSWAHMARQEDVIAEVHAMLCIWAETWPDQDVRARLLMAIRKLRGGDKA